VGNAHLAEQLVSIAHYSWFCPPSGQLVGIAHPTFAGVDLNFRGQKYIELAALPSSQKAHK
jgi:hypothetical protein